jgi:hypothetical protein
LSCAESLRKPAQARLVLVGWGANRELRTELLGQPAFQADDGLIAYLVLLWQEAVGFAQLLLRQPLHADKKAALLAGPACPFFNQLIDGFPPAKIEVADAEVGALRDIERLAQSRKEFEFNVVKDAWHS